MEIKFKRFNPLTDTIKPFDCGDADLNGFLLESNEDVPNATQHAKQLLAVTYLIEDIESGKNLRSSAPRTTKKSRSPGTLLLNARNGHFPFYPIYNVRPAAAGLSTTGLQIALHATRSPVTLCGITALLSSQILRQYYKNNVASLNKIQKTSQKLQHFLPNNDEMHFMRLRNFWL